MGSSQKYWQYARECARWARETKQEDDRELFERMSKAWVKVAWPMMTLLGRRITSLRGAFIPKSHGTLPEARELFV